MSGHEEILRKQREHESIGGRRLDVLRGRATHSQRHKKNLQKSRMENQKRIKSKKRKFAANHESIKLLTAEGWTCAIVEQRIPHTWITRDCFSFGDILACSPTKGIMLIQVTGSTGGGNFSARIAKTKAEPRHAIWLAAGGRIQIHCWTKRANKKERECRVLELTKERA